MMQAAQLTIANSTVAPIQFLIAYQTNRQFDGACIWLPSCRIEPAVFSRRPRLSFMFELRRAAPVQFGELGNAGPLLLRPTAEATGSECVRRFV